MRVRYEGPEQGIMLLCHKLEQFGVVVRCVTRPAEDPPPVERVVSVELDVVGDTDRRRLASDVRGALQAFAAIYHRAGLDFIEA